MEVDASMTPTVDRDGYPTDETLDALRQWDLADANAALDFLQVAWTYPNLASHDLSVEEFAVVHADASTRHLRLSTGGWSGNEDLIYAFRESLAWRMTWRLSAIGGLHIFRYR